MFFEWKAGHKVHQGDVGEDKELENLQEEVLYSEYADDTETQPSCHKQNCVEQAPFCVSSEPIEERAISLFKCLVTPVFESPDIEDADEWDEEGQDCTQYDYTEGVQYVKVVVELESPIVACIIEL